MRQLSLALLSVSLLFALEPVRGQQAPTGPMVVTLLGTGTPHPRVNRMGPGTLIEAGGQRLLFDVGRGTTIRLAQAGIVAGAIDAVFLTHLHSDHTNGLPDLWLTGWLPPLGGRKVPLRVIGPAGTRGMAQGLQSAFAEDIRMRTVEERLPPSGVALDASEFDADGTVFDNGGIRVTAFAVDHGGELRPAYGFRVTYGGRSVVISGDTRYSENLIRHSAGADVILHEVVAAPPQARDLPSAKFRLSHHTSAAEAARIFALTRPRLAVFTHLALVADQQGRSATAEDVLSEASQTYAGRMEIGEDLMRIVVGDTIDVQRPQRTLSR